MQRPYGMKLSRIFTTQKKIHALETDDWSATENPGIKRRSDKINLGLEYCGKTGAICIKLYSRQTIILTSRLGETSHVLEEK